MPQFTLPPHNEVCVIREAPPPWTKLPWTSIQGITGEELLVYFPNHALTWPAICERLAWEFPSYVMIADIINNSSRWRVYLDGSRFPAITPEKVMLMMTSGRRAFQQLWAHLPLTGPSAAEIHLPMEYLPPVTWNIRPEQLLPPLDLVSVARRLALNPYFRGVQNTSTFSYEVRQAQNGWVRAATGDTAPNPPAMPAGWNHPEPQIPLYIGELVYIPIQSHIPGHPPCGYADMTQPPPGYTLVSNAASAQPPSGIPSGQSSPPQEAINVEAEAEEKHRRRRQQARYNRIHEPVKPDFLMSSLPPEVQRNVPKLIELGMPSINGEVILFLLDRYGGNMRLQELALALTPFDKRHLPVEVKSLSQRLTARLFRALEYRANLRGVTQESEKVYWRKHIETPPFGKEYEILDTGPPPREGEARTQENK